jgi:transcriptional regulator with XRE-family HTH domain
MGDKTTTEVDYKIGATIRAIRVARGFSQEALAEAVGLTFQQIQKYELGRNRVSVSRLVQIAETLGMPITWFFEGVAENGGAAPGIDDDMRTLFTTRSGNDLAKAFLAIEDTDSRQILIDVARALCRTPVKNAAGRGRPKRASARG